VIELEDLGKRYGGAVVVEGLSLRVERGELLVLVGGSGAGKTTTLKMINRLIEPTSGAVRLAGVDHRSIPGHELRRRIGYCFQQVGLFPHLSVAENVAVVPHLLGWPARQIAARVAELLERVGLAPGEFASRAPDALSGGQAQRVGLARALAARPEVLLLDEPFGALDPVTRERLQRWFAELIRELGTTAIFVTHDAAEALLLGDRIAVLGGGRLLQVGAPEELLRRPAHPAVAELLATPRRQAEALARVFARARAPDGAPGA
jgi:osmoprotectant transport system ATP-binding protein